MSGRETRSTKVSIYLEPTIDTAMKRVVPSTSTVSDYIRKLIVSDLLERGLLTEKMLADILI